MGEPQKVAGKRNAAVQVKIPVTVKEGYHVNSNKPSEEYLIPLKLTWTQTGALEGGTVTYPKPALEKYEFSETPLSVYTGAFDLVANFKVAATTLRRVASATRNDWGAVLWHEGRFHESRAYPDLEVMDRVGIAWRR